MFCISFNSHSVGNLEQSQCVSNFVTKLTYSTKFQTSIRHPLDGITRKREELSRKVSIMGKLIDIWNNPITRTTHGNLCWE